MQFQYLSFFVLLASLGMSNAHAMKKCECIWMKDATTANYTVNVNLVQWNYNVKVWNEFTIKNRLPECITECKKHLFDHAEEAKNKICANHVIYPPVPANSAIKYRLGVRAAVNRPLLNLNIQDAGPYPVTPEVTKKIGQPCGY